MGKALTILHDTGDFRIIVCFHAVLDVAIVVNLHLKQSHVLFVTTEKTQVHHNDRKYYNYFGEMNAV